jgi:hypothetical protein
MTTAKFIDYPSAQLHPDGTSADTRSTWLFVLTVALAAGAGALPTVLRRAGVVGAAGKARTTESALTAGKDRS